MSAQEPEVHIEAPVRRWCDARAIPMPRRELSDEAALLIAAVITLSRAAKADVGFAPMIGGIVPTVLGLAVLGWLGEPVRVDNAAWHVFNGMVLLPIAYWCLATGPRYISAPEVSMFYLLETVLAPVWVWLIFSEAPRPAVLIGGALLIGALGAHALWQLRVHGRRVQPSAGSSVSRCRRAAR